MSDDLELTARRARHWLLDTTLPFWSTRGFDATVGLFEEQISFQHHPNIAVPRRVMVQSRQISVFAAASLAHGVPQSRELALAAMRQTIKAFHAVDGAPGWVFSIGRTGEPVDRKRDLYAHAFVLFALAWAMRLQRAPEFEAAVAATLEVLDQAFADPGAGGLWDCLPRPDALRRQNPHMHLFEAYIALYETTGRGDVLARGRALRDLAVRHFIDPTNGALREYFNDDWSVHPAPGQGSVEPGHLFEWAWLMRRWEAVSGEDQGEVVGQLVRLARWAGLDPERGRIVDEISENGAVRRRSSRSWPHAEALKSLVEEQMRAGDVMNPEIEKILSRLLDIYCCADLEGIWIDHVDEDDKPLSAYAPASTLYHVYFGVDAVLKLMGSDG